MPSLEFRPAARADLQEIWHYSFRTWSQHQADRYVAMIRSVVVQLLEGQKQGRPVPGSLELMRYAVGAHFIYYHWTDAGLEVIRILHQRMDPDRHL